MGETLKITEAQKKELEALTPFNINSSIWYVAKQHVKLPEEIKPSFKVRPFRKNETERVRKLLSNVKDSDETELRDFARLCIVDMKNLYDAGTGDLVEYKAAPDGGMDKDLFSTMPIIIMSDILMYVSRISGILAPEKISL